MTSIPKPCPFCGGDPEIREWDWPYVRYLVRCSSCKAQAKARKALRSEAIAAWNKRTA
jgi:Lar family restriction alleviation protein